MIWLVLAVAALFGVRRVTRRKDHQPKLLLAPVPSPEALERHRRKQRIQRIHNLTPYRPLPDPLNPKNLQDAGFRPLPGRLVGRRPSKPVTPPPRPLCGCGGICRICRSHGDIRLFQTTPMGGRCTCGGNPFCSCEG